MFVTCIIHTLECAWARKGKEALAERGWPEGTLAQSMSPRLGTVIAVTNFQFSDVASARAIGIRLGYALRAT